MSSEVTHATAEGGYDSPSQKPKDVPKVEGMNKLTLNNGIEIPALGLGASVGRRRTPS